MDVDKCVSFSKGSRSSAEAERSRPKSLPDYFPLLMTEDKKTEMYIKFAKVLVIYQGPYSETRKESIQCLQSKFTSCLKLISDSSYKRDKKNPFRYDQTECYYDYLQQSVQKAMEESADLIVIDATMSNFDQNCFYFSLAFMFNYVVLTVPPIVTESYPNWPSNTQAHSFMQVGQPIGCPNMFQHFFCGYFLHDIDSIALRDLASLFAQDCFEDIREFSSVYAKHGMHSQEDFKSYYHMLSQWEELAHCSLKTFHGQDVHLHDYFKTPEVRKRFGKMEKLLISGFVFTPHIVAARVKLTHEQKKVWDKDDHPPQQFVLSESCSERIKLAKIQLPAIKAELCDSKGKQTLERSDFVVADPLENIRPHVRGRTCHFILGKTDEATSEMLDNEVAHALQREQDDVEVHELRNSSVKHVGKYWIIYLNEMYNINALFSTFSMPFEYQKLASGK